MLDEAARQQYLGTRAVGCLRELKTWNDQGVRLQSARVIEVGIVGFVIVLGAVKNANVAEWVSYIPVLSTEFQPCLQASGHPNDADHCPQ